MNMELQEEVDFWFALTMTLIVILLIFIGVVIHTLKVYDEGLQNRDLKLNKSLDRIKDLKDSLRYYELKEVYGSQEDIKVSYFGNKLEGYKLFPGKIEYHGENGDSKDRKGFHVSVSYIRVGDKWYLQDYTEYRVFKLNWTVEDTQEIS